MRTLRGVRESCHYYVANPKPEHVPAYRAEQLRKIYRQLNDPIAKIAPGWIGAAELDQEMIEKLIYAAFGTCTMCGRCVINCPMGVDTRQIIRTARAMLTAIDMTPEGLKATVNVHLQDGNNMGVSDEDYVETVQWMEEELQAELDDPTFKIPINKPHAPRGLHLQPARSQILPLSDPGCGQDFQRGRRRLDGEHRKLGCHQLWLCSTATMTSPRQS